MAAQEVEDFGLLVDGLASQGVVGDGGGATVDDVEFPPSDSSHNLYSLFNPSHMLRLISRRLCMAKSPPSRR
ncbi:hypothetical protein U1Q18_047280 [Sarracenia purpurea var. burkii]